MSCRYAISLAVAFPIFVATAVAVGAQESSGRTLTVEDIFRFASVSSPMVSPDGSRAAYVVGTRDLEGNSGRSSVWMAPIAGGEPRRMTSDEASASSPRFSPDGRYLSFLAARGEGARQQVWVLDLRGGEARALTSVEQGVEGYEWSPDSERLALLVRDKEPEGADDAPEPPWVIDRLQFKQDYRGYLDRRRPHLYVFDIASKELRQLTEGDYDHSSIAWSPDGSRIAFVSNRTVEPDENYDTDVWVVSSEVDSERGPLKVSTSTGSDGGPAWSPDGGTLAWLTSLRPEVGGYAMSHLAIATPGGDQRVLTEELDRNIGAPRFSDDGSHVLALLETEGARHLIAVPLDGSAVLTLWEGERNVQELALVPGGGAVVVASGPESPPDLWLVESSGGRRQLTHHNRELLQELRLGRVVKERVTAPDGTGLDAFYTFPPGVDEPEALPTILWIHGGPMSQDGWGWHAVRQLFAASGYLVVQPNYRGSHGYGQEFALRLWQNWGGPERIDAIASVDHAIERGWADPDRLGVGGWSYGGITTNAVITHTDRFKAAVSGAGAALYVAAYGHDQYQRWYEQELGTPWENRELWERISTFNRVEQITTPTLWMGGERDWNVPISQGELMYQSMKRLGRETLLVVYPGQGHGRFPPAYESDRYRRWLGWFGRYLIGDDSAWPEGN
ncbi:MAG: S9 family peptidase [Gemmatimonadota bacterium]|nr:S9 family peptidase [Gemmatimonadota bacterium]